MLEYSDYKDVIEILSRTDNDNTYQDLLKKEDKVLDTINAVVKTYKDRNIVDKQFINRPIAENISRFWMDMNLMAKELFNIGDISQIITVLQKGERIIYIGLICMMFALILFFVDISK